MSEADIRAALANRTLTPDEALPLVDAALMQRNAASLHVLRATLIQLSEASNLTLEDARASLERAVDLAPDDPEAYEELGHFFDAVMPDRQKAEECYRLALARGAGPACREALEELRVDRRQR